MNEYFDQKSHSLKSTCNYIKKDLRALVKNKKITNELKKGTNYFIYHLQNKNDSWWRDKNGNGMKE